jgi:hypothetical protein
VTDEQGTSEQEAAAPADPLVAALDEGLGEFERLDRVRDGTPAAEPVEASSGADEAVDRPTPEDLAAQAEWRREKEREADEQAALGQAHYARQQWNELEVARQQLVLRDSLERLDLSAEEEDVVAAWHGADAVRAEAPELLSEYLGAWYSVDPRDATRYARSVSEDEAAQFWAAQAAEAQYAEAFNQVAEAEQQQAAEDGRRAAADAFTKAILNYKADDPRFAKLLATEAVPVAQELLGQLPPADSPEVAKQAAQIVYEGTLHKAAAEERAKFHLPLDEMEWFGRQKAGEDLPPWNAAEALERLTAAELRPVEVGAISEARRRAQAGAVVHAGPTRDFAADLAEVDALVEHQAAQGRERDRMGREIERGKAEREAAKNRRPD